MDKPETYFKNLSQRLALIDIGDRYIIHLLINHGPLTVNQIYQYNREQEDDNIIFEKDYLEKRIYYIVNHASFPILLLEGELMLDQTHPDYTKFIRKI